MRIRTIKPEYWPHPVMSRQPDDVRLAAIALLNIADDEGYFFAEPAIIRSAIWPFDEDSSRARRVLATLTAVGWIEVKLHPSHGSVGRVVNFTKHQRIDRASDSKLKVYFLDESSTNDRRVLDERSSPDQGSGIRDQGTREQGSIGARAPNKSETRPKSLEEAQAYFKAIGGSEVEAARFWDHFMSNGWKVGGRAAMKDWRAAARNWRRNGANQIHGRGSHGQAVRETAICGSDLWDEQQRQAVASAESGMAPEGFGVG